MMILLVMGVVLVFSLIVVDVVRGGYIFLACLGGILDISAWMSKRFHGFVKKLLRSHSKV